MVFDITYLLNMSLASGIFPTQTKMQKYYLLLSLVPLLKLKITDLLWCYFFSKAISKSHTHVKQLIHEKQSLYLDIDLDFSKEHYPSHYDNYHHLQNSLPYMKVQHFVHKYNQCNDIISPSSIHIHQIFLPKLQCC